jgi:hypothetical protein
LPGDFSAAGIDENERKDEACSTLRDLAVLTGRVLLLNDWRRHFDAVLATHGGGVGAEHEEVLINDLGRGIA